MNLLILGPKDRNINIIDFLKKQGNNVYLTENEINLEFLKYNNIDFLISNGYASIIKKELIDKYNKKIINIHPTYLPYGRGIYPLVWALLENSPIGVSIHFIDYEIDAGDIILRKKVNLDEELTLQEAYFILLREANKLFIDNWTNILNGNFQCIKQTLLQPYRSRNISEKYISIFYNLWNTKLKRVKKMHKLYKNNQIFVNFIKEKYD